MTHDVRSSCLSVECFLDGLPTEAARPGTSPPTLLRASEDNLRCCAAQVGGARRDRTDDLKLAKLALSQLSYGPDPERNSLLALRVETGGPGTS